MQKIYVTSLLCPERYVGNDELELADRNDETYAELPEDDLEFPVHVVRALNPEVTLWGCK